MAQKKKILEHQVDLAVVGAGPAGLFEALQAPSTKTVKVIEAEDRLWGRWAHGALHLIREELGPREESQILGEACLRWEREWIDPCGFEFSPKEWSLVVPQWKHYMGSKMSLWSEPESSAALIEKVSLSSPVSALERQGNAWKLQTPESVYIADSVVWAAGLESFQNAYGKEPAREFQVANPRYQPDAREAMGGIALNWVFSKGQTPQVVDQVPADRVLMLPVKHNKLYYLAIAVFIPGPEASLKTLTYLPLDILKHPKEVLSFQKSLRRVMRTLFPDGVDIEHREIMIQTPRMCGHSLGMPWVLSSAEFSGLRFVGDETLTALEASEIGLASAVDDSDLEKLLVSASSSVPQSDENLADAVSAELDESSQELAP